MHCLPLFIAENLLPCWLIEPITIFFGSEFVSSGEESCTASADYHGSEVSEDDSGDDDGPKFGGSVESGGVAGAVCCGSGDDDGPKFGSGVESGGVALLVWYNWMAVEHLLFGYSFLLLGFSFSY